MKLKPFASILAAIARLKAIGTFAQKVPMGSSQPSLKFQMAIGYR